MLEMAKADKDAIIYDIGCGDGRIVIYAAKKFGARGVGIDIDPQRIKESKDNAKKAGVEKLVKFRLEDATKTDISAATIVTLISSRNPTSSSGRNSSGSSSRGRSSSPTITSSRAGRTSEIDSTTVNDADGKEHSVFLYKR